MSYKKVYLKPGKEGVATGVSILGYFPEPSTILKVNLMKERW